MKRLFFGALIAGGLLGGPAVDAHARERIEFVRKGRAPEGKRYTFPFRIDKSSGTAQIWISKRVLHLEVQAPDRPPFKIVEDERVELAEIGLVDFGDGQDWIFYTVYRPTASLSPFKNYVLVSPARRGRARLEIEVPNRDTKCWRVTASENVRAPGYAKAWKFLNEIKEEDGFGAPCR